jgi:hypothetical protein
MYSGGRLCAPSLACSRSTARIALHPLPAIVASTCSTRCAPLAGAHSAGLTGTHPLTATDCAHFEGNGEKVQGFIDWEMRA